MTSLLSSFSGMLGYETIPRRVIGMSFYDLRAVLPGKDKVFDFGTMKGKVVLIVNTASQCHFTSQYTGLEELHNSYFARGLEVLGFPSNEFGGQEPGSDEDIASFCTLNHGVTFPLMKKSEVNGQNMNDVFAWLKSQKGVGVGGIAGTTAVKWNFTKFLVDREGHLVGRYGPNTKPDTLKAEIEKML